MKKLIIKALKICLVITLLVLLALLVVGLVLWLNWPWWVAGCILLGLFGLWLVWLFIRKILLRRREQQFVGQVIEQDEAFIKGMTADEKESLKELQKRWQEAIEALRASHLKKSGNPLYVLPWYMIIGESGSGKTTAIESAQLSSPFAETNRVSGLSGTRNCDWWFFEQAIILDTAGRYAIPVDESRDKEEWQKFLTLLVKYRKKEPLNGLVVTISADKLLSGEPEALADDGRNIRRRIDELMRVMGSKFPVYVLVTKCDLVQGMTQFCDSLPENVLEQAMGVAKQNLKTDVRGFVTRVAEVIGERLGELRLLLLHRSSHTIQGPRRPKPDLLLFPEEFQRLSQVLAPFVESTFQDNPYQETPLLRGIYFSSGRQEGTPYSHFLSSLGLIEEKQVLPGTSRGLFLHELFAGILPRDRKLFAPTQRSIAWGRLTRNIGLAGWLALGLAVCGLLSFAFVKNLSTIRIAANEFAKPTLLKGEILTDVQILERHRQAVLSMEKHNRNWWIPRFGLHQSIEVETELKSRYCKKFNDHFTAIFDPILTQSVAKFSPQTDFEIIAPHVAHLTRRINLLTSRLDRKGMAALKDRPHPSYELLLYTSDAQLAPELSNRIANLYLYYLLWQTDTDELTAEHQRLRNLLQHMLTIRDLNLSWLVTWVNTNPDFKYLSLKDFWGNQLTEEGSTSLAPAFTLAGKKSIDGMVKEIESALIDPMIIAGKKVDFQQWYPLAYTKAWYEFGLNFREGEYLLNGRDAWQQVAGTMATEQGPYLALLDRMAEELTIIKDIREMPPWIQIILELQITRTLAQQSDLLGSENKILAKTKAKGKSIFNRATAKGRRLVDKIQRRIGSDPLKEQSEAQLLAAQAFKTYETALTIIAETTSSRKLAFESATTVFNDDPTSSESPFYIARNALTGLNRAMALPDSEQQMFWGLLSGSLEFLRDYTYLETACHLNTLWDKGVLLEIEGIADKSRIHNLLFGPEGIALNYIRGPAGPFLAQDTKKGFHAKAAMGRKLPFDHIFMIYLTKAMRMSKFGYDFVEMVESPPDLVLGSDPLLNLYLDFEPDLKIELEPEPPPVQLRANYPVTIRALTTDANPGARIRPHKTTLSLSCSNRTTKLVNLNYPVSKKFNWSPAQCHDVQLQIEVGDLILKHRYNGNRAFANFLLDFIDGSRTFRPEDFPKHKDALNRMDISSIRVNYQFTGQDAVLEVLDIDAGKITGETTSPEQISRNERELEDVKAILSAWGRRQQEIANESEAQRRAHEARQARRAAEVKKAWEAKLPEVPEDILTCWKP